MKLLDPQQLALRFYQTLPHACSYLANQEATTIFLDPEAEITHEVYSQLSLKGFRRSGAHLYRPQCLTCRACKSARVKVANFAPSKQQLRVLKRNQQLSAHLVPAGFNEEHYQLYAKYLNARHADGDMYPASKEQFTSFLTSDFAWAKFVEFRTPEKQLLAVAAIDQLADGLAAIYTFYDPSPEVAKLSPGVYAVLWQISYAQQLKLPYVYLGYYIEESAKMNYKKNYQPLEIFDQHLWQEFCP